MVHFLVCDPGKHREIVAAVRLQPHSMSDMVITVRFP